MRGSRSERLSDMNEAAINKDLESNDAVAYVPLDQIPLEWRPPEQSPRLKSWAPCPSEFMGTIAASLGPENQPLTIGLIETHNRLALCSERLKQSYLEWFDPMGPPGSHAHVHYRSPQDEHRRSTIQSAMVVDYEAFLVFLDVALELHARAVGVFVGREKMTWKHMLQAAEEESAARPAWLPAETARAVRHLQRTAIYARNKAVVHPRLHYVAVRTDETGNISYLRLPTRPPSQVMLTELDGLLRRHYQLRENAEIGRNGFAPVIGISLLDKISGDLDDAERKSLEHLRDGVGYELPSVREIAETMDTLFSGLVEYFGERARQSRDQRTS